LVPRLAHVAGAYKSLLDTAKERLESLKERLEGKDGSQYSKLTHKELQDRVIKFVEGVRTWFAQSEAENRGIADQQWHAMVHAQTKEQKQQLWQAHTGTLTNGLFTLMRDFDQKFKVDAILLRDELLSRLPATEKSVQANRRYEHPVNTFCINEIADDLERKAKLLR
jgi:exonuclease VII large subunit